MKIFFNTRKSMLRKEKFTKIFFIYRCRPLPGRRVFLLGHLDFAIMITLLTTPGIRLMGAARRRKRGKRWLVREDRTGWEAREAAAGGKTESHATLSLVSFHLLTPVSSHANSCILLCCLMWISRAPDLLPCSRIILRNMLCFLVFLILRVLFYK